MNDLNPLELHILKQFDNKNWYYNDILNFISNQNLPVQQVDFAIYQLRAKNYLNTYYDNNFRQYFSLNTVSKGYLDSISQKNSVQNLPTTNDFLSKLLSPTKLEIDFLKQNKIQDDKIRELTIDNFKIQKKSYWLNIIIMLLTAISVGLAIYSLNK